MRLGAGTYQVWVVETMTGYRVVDCSRFIESLTWRNSLNEDGPADVTLTGATRDCLRDLNVCRGVVHELVIARDGKVLYVGPLMTRPIGRGGKVRISAKARTWWWANRWCNTDVLDNLSTDDYVRYVIRSAFSANDPGGFGNMEFISGIKGSVEKGVKALDDKYVSEAFQGLVGNVIDYSTWGTRTTIMPAETSLGHVGSIPDTMIKGEFDLDRPAEGYFTRSAVRTGTGEDQVRTVYGGGSNLWHGIIVDKRIDAVGASTAIGFREGHDDVPLRTGNGENSTFSLSPDVGINAERFEPGCMVTITSPDIEANGLDLRIIGAGASVQNGVEDFQIIVDSRLTLIP